MFTVAGLFPLKPVMLLIPCHMLLGLLLLNCSSTLFLYCRLAMVQYTITTHVDGDVLKVFWSYCSEVGFIKVPRNNKSCIWVHGFLLTYIPIQFPECLVCVGLRGNVNSCD